MLRKFYSDPYYLAKYCGASLIIFGLADFLLIWFWPETAITFRIKAWHYAMIPAGMYLGVLSAVWIHNATHNSAGPKWINNLIGEICGAHQIYGWLGWKLAHLIHHKYPDDPKFDPHPPGDKPFWEFAKGMKKSLFQCLHNFYMRRWGQEPNVERIIKFKNRLGLLAAIARVLFWYLLLGPSLFLFFYIPSYVTNYLFFSHFNWATHRPTEDGRAEILNLNHNLYYRTMNFLFCGMYFHKNHHRKPSIANPAKV